LNWRNLTFRDGAVGLTTLLLIYLVRWKITGANKNATASQCLKNLARTGGHFEKLFLPLSFDTIPACAAKITGRQLR
jgi:hypothetical protein